MVSLNVQVLCIVHNPCFSDLRWGPHVVLHVLMVGAFGGEGEVGAGGVEERPVWLVSTVFIAVFIPLCSAPKSRCIALY